MDFFNQLSRFMKVILIVAAVVIIYGYLCRYAAIYFFWESEYIGWMLLYIGFIAILLQRIKMKRMIRKESVMEKIIIGIIVFVLLLKSVLLVVTPFTDAYTAAKKYLLSNDGIRAQVGNIQGFSVVPEGNINKSMQADKNSGLATLVLIVKGDKQYRKVTVYVVKRENEQDWLVGGME